MHAMHKPCNRCFVVQKQLADAHDSFEALVEENAKLKAILAAHGLSNELVKASCPATTVTRSQDAATPAAPKKAASQKSLKRHSPPVMTRTNSTNSADTAVCRSDLASSSPSTNSDATYSSPVSVSSAALLPIDEEGQLTLMTDGPDFSAMLPLPAARETSMAADMCMSSFPPAPAPAGGIRGFSVFAGMTDLFAGLPSMAAASPYSANSGFAFAPAPACRSSSLGSVLLSPQPPQLPQPTEQLCGSKRSRMPSSASCGFDLSEDVDDFADEIERQAGQPLPKRSRAFSPLHFMLFGSAVLLACMTMPAGDEGNSISTIRGRMLLSEEMHHQEDEQDLVTCTFAHVMHAAQISANAYMHSTSAASVIDTRCPQTWDAMQQQLGDHVQEFLQGLAPYILHFCLATGPVVGMILAHMWANEPVSEARGKHPQMENHLKCPGSPVSNAALSVTQFMDDIRMGVCQLLEASS
jgi:DNA-directed RNA polymerase subunit N (RpoN/RPB10)